MSKGQHLAGKLHTGYQDIRCVINGYQEKIDQISIKYLGYQYKIDLSIKYLTDFSRLLKNLFWLVYQTIRQISVESGKKVKNLKNRWKIAMFRPNSTAGYQGYQPDIKAFCTPDIMSCHPLVRTIRFDA